MHEGAPRPGSVAPRTGSAGTIVWINGAFGVGKSTVAAALANSWPGAEIFDPEPLGTFLQATAPGASATDDFQDLPAWRDLTRASLMAMARSEARPVIVPMTLVVPGYLDEIVGGLRRAGVTVHHFTLRASRAAIIERLAGRPDTTPWTYEQIDRCLAALDDPRFRQHIETDDRTVGEVVTEIASALERPR